jgi:putative oxidoreductase
VRVADLQLLHEPKRGAIDVFTIWLPRVALAAVFLNVGVQKFGTDTMWIRLFAQIGLGQWLRYLTGVLQILGAIFVLVPATMPFGVLMLAGTMAGAIVAWVFGLHAAANALVPAVLLAALVAVGWQGMSRN